MSNGDRALFAYLAQKDLFFKDTHTGLTLTREQFVDLLNRGSYPKRSVRLVGEVRDTLTNPYARTLFRLK